MTRLKKKWWEEERGGGSCKNVGGGSSDQMGVAALAGLYMMLIAGIAFAAIIRQRAASWGTLYGASAHGRRIVGAWV